MALYKKGTQAVVQYIKKFQKNKLALTNKLVKRLEVLKEKSKIKGLKLFEYQLIEKEIEEILKKIQDLG